MRGISTASMPTLSTARSLGPYARAALRAIEGQLDDGGRARLLGNHDVGRRPAPRERRLDISQAAVSIERGRVAAARPPAHRPAVELHQTILARHAAVDHHEADEPLPRPFLLRPQQRLAAEERAYVELDDEPKTGLERVDRLVQVVAVEEVAGLQTERIP